MPIWWGPHFGYKLQKPSTGPSHTEFKPDIKTQDLKRQTAINTSQFCLPSCKHNLSIKEWSQAVHIHDSTIWKACNMEKISKMQCEHLKWVSELPQTKTTLILQQHASLLKHLARVTCGYCCHVELCKMLTKRKNPYSGDSNKWRKKSVFCLRKSRIFKEFYVGTTVMF